MTSQTNAQRSADADARAQFSRRDFMQVSLAGSIALTVAGTAATLSGCSRETATAQGFRVLRAQDITLLTRALPGSLDGALPDEPRARAAAVQQAVKSFDQLMWDTSPAVRGVFLQLLDLMNLGITRGPLFGLWKSWDNATEADGAAVIAGMANSSLGFLRGAYNGLNTMALMAWYLEPAHQLLSHYPGPPKKVIG